MPTTVTTDLRPWLDSMHEGFEEALSDRERAAAAAAPRVSGEYASRMGHDATITANGVSGAVTNSSAYAGAVERGANVGKRRGPHMRGEHPIGRAMAGFGDALAARLRSHR